MARAATLKRLQANDYPPEVRRLVETVNAFFASTSDAIGTLPNLVVREITVTMPAAVAQPTLSGTWTTLYGTVGYTKTGTTVALQGVLTGGTYGPTALFTLPSAFCPSAERLFPVAQSSAVYTPAGLLQVFPTGEVVAPAVTSVQTGQSVFLSLDGVTFQTSDGSPQALSTALNVTAGDLSSVTGVVAVACFDGTSGSPVAAPCPVVGWAPTATGIQITSLVGLSPSRRYTIRLVLAAF